MSWGYSPPGQPIRKIGKVSDFFLSGNFLMNHIAQGDKKGTGFRFVFCGNG